MSFLSFPISLFRINSRCSITWCMFRRNAANSSSLLEPDFTPKFSPDEQEKILNTLNQWSREQLLRLNVSQAKIKNLETYRNKKGPFKSLTEVLEVDGLGVKVLEKLCETIISNDAAEVENDRRKNQNGNKRFKNILVPNLNENNITSAVGVHLATTGVSWAKVSMTNLQNWGCKDFGSLPKKMLPTDNFELAISILKKLPSSDVYIFEGTPSMSLQAKSQPTAVASYTQQLELTSMLLALLNTSTRHNNVLNENCAKEHLNRVYFLKSKLPARMFKTLVGNEKVSAITTVSQLIDINSQQGSNLPCTPISVDEKLRDDYLAQSSAHKELLGQALMLAVAFTDLCVRKNPDSLKAISPGRR